MAALLDCSGRVVQSREKRRGPRKGKEEREPQLRGFPQARPTTGAGVRHHDQPTLWRMAASIQQCDDRNKARDRRHVIFIYYYFHPSSYNTLLRLQYLLRLRYSHRPRSRTSLDDLA